MSNCLEYCKMAAIRSTTHKSSQQLYIAAAYKYVYVILQGTTPASVLQSGILVTCVSFGRKCSTSRETVFLMDTMFTTRIYCVHNMNNGISRRFTLAYINRRNYSFD